MGQGKRYDVVVGHYEGERNNVKGQWYIVMEEQCIGMVKWDIDLRQ